MRPRTAADLDLQRARTDGVLCRFFIFILLSRWMLYLPTILL